MTVIDGDTMCKTIDCVLERTLLKILSATSCESTLLTVVCKTLTPDSCMQNKSYVPQKTSHAPPPENHVSLKQKNPPSTTGTGPTTFLLRRTTPATPNSPRRKQRPSRPPPHSSPHHLLQLRNQPYPSRGTRPRSVHPVWQRTQSFRAWPSSCYN